MNPVQRNKNAEIEARFAAMEEQLNNLQKKIDALMKSAENAKKSRTKKTTD